MRRRVLRHSSSLSKGTLEACVYVAGVNNAENFTFEHLHLPLSPPAHCSKYFVRKGEQNERLLSEGGV